MNRLLTVQNCKIIKGNSKGYKTLILHLAPTATSGYQVCPFSSPGCRAGCLHTAGQGRYYRVHLARVKRTRLWFEKPAAFKYLVRQDLDSLIRHCEKHKMKPAVRLNGTSDIDWAKVWPELFRLYPTVQFYDYTKDYRRVFRKQPPNYYLLFSRSENTQKKQIDKCIANGVNVYCVFSAIPRSFLGYPVHNGDKNDLRFLDHPGIIGVTPKGRAKHDKTGFVIRQGTKLLT